MPSLHHNGRVADSFLSKAEMLKDKFFPPPPEAELTDTQGFIHPQAQTCPLVITKEEVAAAIRRPKADKAPGPDGIPNRILQACGDSLVEMLTPLF